MGVVDKVLLLRDVVVVLEPVPVQGVLSLVSRHVGDVDRVRGHGPLVGLGTISIRDAVNILRKVKVTDKGILRVCGVRRRAVRGLFVVVQHRVDIVG